MADNAPLKYTDILNMLGNARDQSLAMTILPGQGGIPAASPDFLAANPQLTSNLPYSNKYSGDSLAGTLGQMKEYMFNRPGQQAMQDQQDRGFFARTLDERFRGVGQ